MLNRDQLNEVARRIRLRFDRRTNESGAQIEGGWFPYDLDNVLLDVCTGRRDPLLGGQDEDVVEVDLDADPEEVGSDYELDQPADDHINYLTSDEANAAYADADGFLDQVEAVNEAMEDGEDYYVVVVQRCREGRLSLNFNTNTVSYMGTVSALPQATYTGKSRTLYRDETETVIAIW